MDSQGFACHNFSSGFFSTSVPFLHLFLMISIRQSLRSKACLWLLLYIKAKSRNAHRSRQARAEVNKAEVADLEGPCFSPPADKCQEAMEPSGAKASDFSKGSGHCSETI